MRKLFFTLAFVFVASFGFANSAVVNTETNTEIDSHVLVTWDDDICSITIEIYRDGELVGYGTGVNHDGDCLLAEIDAYIAASAMLSEG